LSPSFTECTFHTFGGSIAGGGSLRRFLAESSNPLSLLTGLLEKVAIVKDEALAELREHHVLLSKDQVLLTAPIPDPSKIIAVGMNYLDHCREQRVEPPSSPVLFAKFPSSLTAHGTHIEWESALTQEVDYEAELGVIIGRRANHVSAADAFTYVLGYVPINDISARDLQFGDKQWVRGKSLDSFCPMGPAIVTTDEVPDPHALGIRCSVNGVMRQDSNTSEMIFRIPELIEFITRAITLEAGDVISTGTPHGVGVFRKPPIFLEDGDEVVVQIDQLGELRNRCRIRHS
jgi:2-keto-4-pentenoate hydratase/2-oxohepta-3-ene-1,7-dioic acid hydratase in catechol pathway